MRLGEKPKASTLPPPRRRYCVLIGLAVEHTTGKGNAKVRYDWPAVRNHWYAWPTANLSEFCRKYDIPFAVAMKHGKLSVEDKLRVLSRRSKSYRDLVLQQTAVLGATGTNEVERVASILDSAEEVASLGVRYARARLARESTDGRLVVSTITPPTEVKRLLEILARACETLKDVAAMRRGSGAGVDTGDVDPAPVLTKGPGGLSDKPKKE